VPELSDMADITQRISQARQLFDSMNRQVLGTKKIPMDNRRRLYQAIVVNIALWGSDSWALKEEKGRNWNRFTIAVSAGYAGGDVGYEGETDHERKD
jgi:hypothetical protein